MHKSSQSYIKIIASVTLTKHKNAFFSPFDWVPSPGMLKFMLLDLFSFRSVGSKPKLMQIMTILNILNILKIIKMIKIVIMELALLFLLTFTIGDPIFFDL